MKNFALQRARLWLAVFCAGLVLSGLTAFPLQWETGVLHQASAAAGLPAPLVAWIAHVHQGLTETYARYPFLAYGTDWLAFAHLVIALAFIGPWRNPVRNRWVIDWGLLCCAAIIPLALIAGAWRGIPWFWRLVDCSFAAGGAVPLWLARRQLRHLSEA